MYRNLHLTPQRKSVYDIVSQSADHPTAADVMERLRQAGHKLAYATVYNSLRYLTDAGVIQELRMGSGAARYDARLEAHQHVVCTQCGRVDEIFEVMPAGYAEAITNETGYRVDHVDVVAKGVCPDCAKSSRH
ncbi:Fur family transcriptional regulator [Alicyclobacillus sp. ALC3]|uniref:Fur family transcriptional regulator n=1 Tax=Alicyclobacillus sp. ALC3 TaxID=2796143 RepID=UPI002379C70E|nr:transcriptional repressor [Alicyclobacillus sp. ALC3]WDL97151.1 transcriptional repressor [Alicyclobacillus sp. ALC3]